MSDCHDINAGIAGIRAMDRKRMIDWLDSHGCTSIDCVICYTPLKISTTAICQCVHQKPPHQIIRVLHFHKKIRDDELIDLQEYV